MHTIMLNDQTIFKLSDYMARTSGSLKFSNVSDYYT